VLLPALVMPAFFGRWYLTVQLLLLLLLLLLPLIAG
jgi:hypothetical protein